MWREFVQTTWRRRKPRKKAAREIRVIIRSASPKSLAAGTRDQPPAGPLVQDEPGETATSSSAYPTVAGGAGELDPQSVRYLLEVVLVGVNASEQTREGAFVRDLDLCLKDLFKTKRKSS